MTRTLDILDRLIAFPTVSSVSNLDLIDWAAHLLQQAGFEITRIPSATGQKTGLFARIGPKVDGGVCLSGHTDVVPVEGQTWTRPEFKLTRDNGRIFGRGTTDMKGFVASALAAAERAQHADVRAPLTLCLSYDEEVGCLGIREMLPALTPLIGKPNAVIVGEPTSMRVAFGHKGKTALKATCLGEAGHSALAPQFLNAIHVATSLVNGLQDLQIALATGVQDAAYAVPYTTVHVAKITGGRVLNIVPDLAVLDFEFRHLPEVPPSDLMRDINAIARRVADQFGHADSISIEQINAYPGLKVATGNPVIGWAQNLVQGNPTTKVAFGTEAGFFADLGFNTVVIGPGDMTSDGHKPDEGLDIDQLTACDQMMDRVIGELSG